MKHLCYLLAILAVFPAIAQEDSFFREDQIYLSVAYPYFTDPPTDLIQNKLSYSIAFGFIRDMPINNKRTLSLGFGSGWSMINIFNNNIFSVDNARIVSTTIQSDYQQNYLRMHNLAFPLELRWRNTSPTKHAFWRIHTGLSLHIPLSFKSYFRSNNGNITRVKLSDNRSFLRSNIHFGFNTWNITISQDLQPLATFNSLNGDFDMKFTKIGLIFYIF